MNKLVIFSKSPISLVELIKEILKIEKEYPDARFEIVGFNIRKSCHYTYGSGISHEEAWERLKEISEMRKKLVQVTCITKSGIDRTFLELNNNTEIPELEQDREKEFLLFCELRNKSNVELHFEEKIIKSFK